MWIMGRVAPGDDNSLIICVLDNEIKIIKRFVAGFFYQKLTPSYCNSNKLTRFKKNVERTKNRVCFLILKIVFFAIKFQIWCTRMINRWFSVGDRLCAHLVPLITLRGNHISMVSWNNAIKPGDKIRVT